MTIRFYEVGEGKIRELEIINGLSTFLGELPKKLGDYNHAWHSPECGYAISFEGDKLGSGGLQVKKICLSAKESRVEEIRKHLEELCLVRGVHIK